MKKCLSVFVLVFCVNASADVISPIVEGPIRTKSSTWSFTENFAKFLTGFGYRNENHCFQIVNYLGTDGKKVAYYELTATACPMDGVVEEPDFLFHYKRKGEIWELVLYDANRQPVRSVGAFSGSGEQILSLCTHGYAGACDLNIDNEGRITAIAVK